MSLSLCPCSKMFLAVCFSVLGVPGSWDTILVRPTKEVDLRVLHLVEIVACVSSRSSAWMCLVSWCVESAVKIWCSSQSVLQWRAPLDMFSGIGGGHCSCEAFVCSHVGMFQCSCCHCGLESANSLLHESWLPMSLSGNRFQQDT